MSKYDSLTRALQNLDGDKWEVSFVEIENLLGFKLPGSAREYNAWWANQLTGPRVQCQSWMNAGFHTSDLKLDAERVTFQRVATDAAEFEGGLTKNESQRSLPEEIRAAKLNIAKLAGVRAENVKITIDY